MRLCCKLSRKAGDHDRVLSKGASSNLPTGGGGGGAGPQHHPAGAAAQVRHLRQADLPAHLPGQRLREDRRGAARRLVATPATTHCALSPRSCRSCTCSGHAAFAPEKDAGNFAPIAQANLLWAASAGVHQAAEGERHQRGDAHRGAAPGVHDPHVRGARQDAPAQPGLGR